jgi:hypothetical protein
MHAQLFELMYIMGTQKHENTPAAETKQTPTSTRHGAATKLTEQLHLL